MADLGAGERQYYLNHVIAPRPIALVSTIDAQGKVNLSPFSYFNLFSVDPPICIFSPSRRVRDNTLKHTLENLQEIPECVINMVDFGMVNQVSLSSSDFPKGINEFMKAGFTEIPSTLIRPPRVKEAPVQLECSIQEIISLGEKAGAGNLVLAEIKCLHIGEELFSSQGVLDQRKLDLVSRLGGEWYGRSTPETLFEIPKPNSKLGIGFDALPSFLKKSEYLTTKDLALLAGIEKIPLKEDCPLLNEDSSKTFKENQELFYQNLKEKIKEGKIQDAWILIVQLNPEAFPNG